MSSPADSSRPARRRRAPRPTREYPEFSIPWLRQRCHTMRDQLLAMAPELFPEDEIARYWPGGARNTFAGPGRWIFCYAQLVRMVGQVAATDAGRPADSAAAEAALEAALADRAELVRLASGDAVQVFPLSLEALEFCATLDRMTLQVQELAAQLQSLPDGAGDRALSLAPLVRSHVVRTWAWVITHGAALPFSVAAEWPEPPEWTRTMTPQDLLALALAHRRVNAQRNALLAQLAPDDHTTKERLSLGAFIGAYAHEHGGDAAQLVKQFALGKLFAQAVSAARAVAAARPAKAPTGLEALG